MRRLGRWYGETPGHLALAVCSFTLCAYAGFRLLRGDWLAVAAWVFGAAFLHDLVLLPLYALADRALSAVLGGWVNHVRVPAFLSGLPLLVFLPLIAGPPERYTPATGQDGAVFLPRWLLLTGVLFGASAVSALVRVVWRGVVRRRGSSRAGRGIPPSDGG